MKKLFMISLLITFPYLIIAQNTTYSPSSMFGLGDLSAGKGGLYAGMGGVNIALRSPNFLNIANPASLTEIENRKFLIDVGVMAAYKSYTQSGVTNNSTVGNINNIGFGFCILPRWYGAVSVSPVSSIGYAITLEQPVEGVENGSISSLFQGEGGISKIGISNAFRINNYLSAGINLSFITGSVTQKETQGSATIEEVSDKKALYADFGLQYKRRLGLNRSVTSGLVYGYSQRLAQSNKLSVSSSSSSNSLEESPYKVAQYLPQFAGIGFAYNSLRWIATADYKYIDWSRMQSRQSTISFSNQHRIAAGAGYFLGNPYKNPVQLMLGAGLYNSYVVVKKQKPENYYISTGLGFTLKNNSVVSVGAKYNSQMNTSQSLQRENSISFFLNITFSEYSYRSKLK